MKRSAQDGFTVQKYAFSLICKAIILIACIHPFQPLLGDDFGVKKSSGIDQIKAGMDQISAGFPQNGVHLLRKGRASIFELREDPFFASLIQISLREEARGELRLALSSTGIQKEHHLDSAEKLLSTLDPSLETDLLHIELLQAQGKREVALQKIDGWLEGGQHPFEKGMYLFAKAKLLFEDESTLLKALCAFEEARYEGEEVQSLRFTLAKKREARGEITEALRTLSKIVNSSPPSPLIAEALNLRGELLEKVGRADLKERQKTCGN